MAPVTESPAEALVPSPGNPPEGYPASGFLQNRDFGKINKNEYNIDLSLQVLDTSTIDAFVKARERWMTVITGDIEDVNVTEALLNVTGMTGVVPETHVMIDACGNPLPELIDDVHFCALEATIDGAGWMDVQWPNAKYYYNIMAIVYPVLLRDDGKVISGNIIFDTCDATNMMNLGLWDDFILKAMGTVLGTMPLAINTKTALVNGTNYVGGYGNDIWSSWGCSGNPPLAYDVYRVPANPTESPTESPSSSPSLSSSPSVSQSPSTSHSPSVSPSQSPTESPAASPTASPTTASPTESPTESPTASPTASPTTASPTESPTESPTASTTASPTTASPTESPTESPTASPTSKWAEIRTTMRSPVWDDCLKNELLSRGKKDSGGMDEERCGGGPCFGGGWPDGGLGIDSPYQGSKLSKLSVALFHDLGYEVNYDGMYLL
jgi:hypothetical protein